MHAFRSFRSKSGAPLALAAAGLWASSTRFERRTVAEPKATAPPPSGVSSRQQQTAGKTARGEQDGPPAATGAAASASASAAAGDEESGKGGSLFPPPIGPMVAVFLDDLSVEKLKEHYPEAKDGQLRTVVLQYGPSAPEREMYRHFFSRKAQVTVTGDASSFARRALVASVSHAGRPVEPMSLSAAIDISPPSITDINEPAVAEKDSPGPLASAVLVEQVKKAGVIEEDVWEGKLPPLLAHGRQFPIESGAYVRLKKPITVSGTICRADWVDGASISCRDTLDGGEKRQEDWEPSDCAICAFYSVTPCSGIFKRFMESSKRRVEYRKTFEPEEQEDDDGEGEQNSQEKPTAVKVSDGEALGAREGATTAVGRVESRNGRRASAAPARAQERGEEHSPAGKAGGGGTTVVGNAAKERLDREAERGAMEEQLENETLAIFNELRECMTFHDLL